MRPHQKLKVRCLHTQNLEWNLKTCLYPSRRYYILKKTLHWVLTEVCVGDLLNLRDNSEHLLSTFYPRAPRAEKRSSRSSCQPSEVSSLSSLILQMNTPELLDWLITQVILGKKWKYMEIERDGRVRGKMLRAGQLRYIHHAVFFNRSMDLKFFKMKNEWAKMTIFLRQLLTLTMPLENIPSKLTHCMAVPIPSKGLLCRNQERDIWMPLASREHLVRGV